MAQQTLRWVSRENSLPGGVSGHRWWGRAGTLAATVADGGAIASWTNAADYGKNLIGRGDDTNSFYQVFALKADVARNVFLHVGYQLYKFRNPNNLMLGVGYRFNGR